MPTPSKTMRFATLLKRYGPIVPAKSLSEADWQKARAEGRYMTIYHADGNDWCTPVMAVLRHDGCVNTLIKAVCAKVPPAHIEDVIGLRDNQDAWDLVNSASA